jgi:hypothetical protein
MPALAADRVQAAVTCKPAGVSLAYNCTVKLSNARTGAPLEKAQLSIGADMPSMPLAHNVPPVTAKATGAPGEYHALVILEMHGDWALRLKVGGPLRDQMVEILNFTPQAVGPPARKAVSPDPAPKPGRKH